MILRSKQIQRLAEMERRVDSGGQPFVRWRDIRMPVSPEVMANLGLRTGQTETILLPLLGPKETARYFHAVADGADRPAGAPEDR
jgi:hypothetical protein